MRDFLFKKVRKPEKTRRGKGEKEGGEGRGKERDTVGEQNIIQHKKTKLGESIEVSRVVNGNNGITKLRWIFFLASIIKDSLQHTKIILLAVLFPRKERLESHSNNKTD